MKIKIKKLKENAKLPKYHHPGDAGMDVFAMEDFVLLPNERKSVSLGWSMEIPEGYVMLCWGKSSLSHKNGIETIGGVIDAGYRGEVFIGLINLSDESYYFEKGDKLCQILIQKVESPEIIEVKNLTDSKRGNGAFGSTGKK